MAIVTHSLWTIGGFGDCEATELSHNCEQLNT